MRSGHKVMRTQQQIHQGEVPGHSSPAERQLTAKSGAAEACGSVYEIKPDERQETLCHTGQPHKCGMRTCVASLTSSSSTVQKKVVRGLVWCGGLRVEGWGLRVEGWVLKVGVEG